MALDFATHPIPPVQAKCAAAGVFLNEASGQLIALLAMPQLLRDPKIRADLERARDTALSAGAALADLLDAAEGG